MPDPQIIVEFMGGPRDGECRSYPEAPPLALLFPLDPPIACLDIMLLAFSDTKTYARYEMESRIQAENRPGQTGSRLRYHYMGKDRVEVMT